MGPRQIQWMIGRTGGGGHQKWLSLPSHFQNSPSTYLYFQKVLIVRSSFLFLFCSLFFIEGRMRREKVFPEFLLARWHLNQRKHLINAWTVVFFTELLFLFVHMHTHMLYVSNELTTRKLSFPSTFCFHLFLWPSLWKSFLNAWTHIPTWDVSWNVWI